jgi:hypothetical protein
MIPWRAHLHDQINIAPVNAEIEAGSAHQRAQFPPCHCVFDLAARLGGKAAVVDADGEVIGVFVPQALKDEFSQKPRVGEHQRGAVRFDQIIQPRHRPAPRMAAPRNAFFLRQHDFQIRRRTILAQHQIGGGNFACPIIPLRRQPFLKAERMGQRCRQRRPARNRRNRLQARQCQRQQIAALTRSKGVHFIDHDAFQPGEQFGAFGIGQQQRERFGRCQQDVGRAFPLAFLAVRRGIAAAGFDPDGQANLVDRGQQVALHILRQCLQGRNIKRVQPIGRNRSVQGRKVAQGWQKSGQRLACAGIRHQQGIAPFAGLGQHFPLVPPHTPTACIEPVGDCAGKVCWIAGHAVRCGGTRPPRQAMFSRVLRQNCAAGR